MAWTEINKKPPTWSNDDDSWRVVQVGAFFMACERSTEAVDLPKHKKLDNDTDRNLVDDPGTHNVTAYRNRDGFRTLADAQAACDAGDMTTGLQHQRGTLPITP